LTRSYLSSLLSRDNYRMVNGFVVGGWNDRREDRSCPAFVCVYEKPPPKVVVGVALFQSQTTYFVFLTQKTIKIMIVSRDVRDWMMTR
jgi:hypothetical protein